MFHVPAENQRGIQFVIRAKPVIHHPLTLRKDACEHGGAGTLAAGDQDTVREIVQTTKQLVLLASYGFGKLWPRLDSVVIHHMVRVVGM
jgi:hypothetical protein